jgi:antitoxin MazE
MCLGGHREERWGRKWDSRGILFVDTHMKTRVQKWGNSLALRIPRPFAEESNLREDSAVDISVRNGRIVVVPIAEPEPSLEELVAKITPRNRHSETETGDAVGNEAW